MTRTLLTVLAFFVVGSTLGQSPESATIRITTWNLEWFPNGSAREAMPERQAQRIQAAADVLKQLNPDILAAAPDEIRSVRDCSCFSLQLGSGRTNDRNFSLTLRVPGLSRQKSLGNSDRDCLTNHLCNTKTSERGRKPPRRICVDVEEICKF